MGASKRVVLLRRQAKLSPQEFAAHWSGPHAQLALGLPGIRNYLQNHVLRTLWMGKSGGPKIDGIAEIEYRDEAALIEAMACDLGTRQLPEDECRFLDSWTGSVVRPTGSKYAPAQRRIVALLHRPSSIAPDEFSSHVERALAYLRPFCLGHLEELLERKTRPSLNYERWPDVFLYFDPPADRNVAELTAPGSPLQTCLSQFLGDTGSAFLVRCEAKRLSNDPD